MPQDYEDLLRMRVVAVVGCSPQRTHASHQVAAYLKESGYRIIPVNPNSAEILGEKCYADLQSIPEKIEAVDIFRRPEFVPDIVDAAIAAGAKGIWLQDGIDAPEAIEKARRAGLKTVVNDCFMRQHVSRMGR